MARANLQPDQADPALASALRTLGAERDGLIALMSAIGDSLGGSFALAVEGIAAARGRVIVTGMGKSGHVARKVAATLASTGTPAHYVHPAEASHGDLGMVLGEDVILALSWSGETTELADLIAYAKRFRVPLIAVTSSAASTLGRQADVCLVLPKAQEACPNGLAPTTSTTMQLALGDALAVALLERRGFGSHDFSLLHPGGKLGRRLVRVDQLMHSGSELPLVGLDAGMSEVLLEMTAKRLGCVGVLNGQGGLAGIITDGDLRRHMSPALLERRAVEIMTAGPKTIRPQALAAEALAVMNQSERPFTVIFVVEDSRPVGALHMHDCLRAGIA
jgi:arabinose-5-phosphate isomerase